MTGLHPRLADGLVGLLLLGAALLSIRVQLQAERLSDPSYRLPNMLLVVIVTAVATLALVVRRRFPLVVLGVTAAALVVARLLDSPEDDIGFAAVLLAAYTAGAYGAVRRRSWVFAVVFGILALELARPFLPHLDEHGALLALAFELVFNLPILAVFWAFGVTIRARRENQRELALRPPGRLRGAGAHRPRAARRCRPPCERHGDPGRRGANRDGRPARQGAGGTHLDRISQPPRGRRAPQDARVPAPGG